MQAASLAESLPNTSRHLMLGIEDASRGDLESALTHLRIATALEPANARAHNELGLVLRRVGQLDAAIASIESAVRLSPDDPELHLRLSAMLHCAGQLERSWDEYEWRMRYRPQAYVGAPSGPQWDGESIAGRTLLICGEGGLGDQIQFIRYARLVREQGGRVIALANPMLQRLFMTADGVDRSIARGKPIPSFDVYAHSMSLPRIMATTLGTIPGEVPYITAPPYQVAQWGEVLGVNNGFRVGINWEGNRNNAEGRNRALPLSGFQPLADIDGLHLYSLQKGPGAENCDSLYRAMRVTDLGPSFLDLRDTAAAVATLDLVVTNDTSVAHLAGALGKPVWVLLPSASCWRWLENRDDSPWYPTMRLFRRGWDEPWDAVFTRVAEALQSRVVTGSVPQN